MLTLLAFIFWITIAGANVPSNLLMELFWNVGEKLGAFLNWCAVPDWFYGIVKDGVFDSKLGSCCNVASYGDIFPLFTILEDFGLFAKNCFSYGRIVSKSECTYGGKQALTMCMGFGCNSAGVTACRIIDSPREKIDCHIDK